MKNGYVCVDLVDVNNGYIHCKEWAISQSWLTDLAITGTQAKLLLAIIASIFLIIKSYKIVFVFFKSL